MAGQGAELTGQIAELAGQIAEQRAEVAEVQTEIANLDTRLSTQIANLDTRLSTQIADLRTEQRTDIAGVRTEIANLETRLIRWMVGTVLAAVGLTFGRSCVSSARREALPASATSIPSRVAAPPFGPARYLDRPRVAVVTGPQVRDGLGEVATVPRRRG